MPVSKLTIDGLRGFSSSQSLRLASPNGNVGSGLTILLGPNNGGKSTIVESVRAFAGSDTPSFTEGKRNNAAGDRIVVTIKLNDGTEHVLRTVDTGGSETVRVPAERPELPIYALPSRRYFNPFFGKGRGERARYAQSVGFPHNRGAALDQFSGRLFNVLRNRQDFNEVLKCVMKPVPDWTIDQSDAGQYYLKFNAGDQFHNSDGLGEGIVSLFFIIDALYDSAPGELIVIDEPELSLHPSYQRRLATLLAEYSEDRQILYATHSPYFSDFANVINGAELARVFKRDNAIQIFQLQKGTAERLGGFLNNLNNPHILGLDAREALFMDDGVVLVEGQEDVVFYSKIASTIAPDLCGRFFGWGVGGADNIGVIAAMLQDLGFQRVAAILDANRVDLLDALRNEFPSYQFAAIPADDVRTKPARPAQDPTYGLVAENGEIRDEFRELAEDLFQTVGDFVADS